MWAMVLKEFLELRRDRRTMALIIMLPLVLLVVFGYAASFNVKSLHTEVVGPQASQVAGKLPAMFEVTKVDPGAGERQGHDALRDDKADVVIVTGAGASPATAMINGANLFAAQQAVAVVGRSGGAMKPEVLFNPQLKTSWVMVPAIIGLILAFIGTIITSLGLVRERQSGTLEQLAVMPFRPSDVIAGKIIPYFLLAALDMLIVTVLGVLLFGVPFAGNVLVFVVGAALFLFVVLGIGVFISTVSQNQGQAMQLAMMVMMPQILLSGMIFPLSSMAAGVRWIAYVLPLTWFAKISIGVMLRGATVSSLWLSLLILAVMAVVVFSAAVARFRRDLAPNMPAAAAPEPSASAAQA
ncbi:ABC transporter permease [Nocardia alni]|uniref:ABC transporter permease n=1 Tax=Nocardia alni TaxID=2815723 RepID=UPI001C228D65|nr:ABC transporter permease [Nocardia alni]